MSNNKQTSLDWFLDELLQLGYIKRLPVTEIQQAKAMHKEETLKLYYQYEDYVLREEGIIKTFGQFYNETYGGNND
jgi:hypothetical protein